MTLVASNVRLVRPKSGGTQARSPGQVWPQPSTRKKAMSEADESPRHRRTVVSGARGEGAPGPAHRQAESA